MRYRLTARAEADVIEIYQWGAETFGEAHADSYHDQLERCFALLAAHPNMARERREFTRPVRLHPHGAHIIVYRDQDDGILIVRVLHGRREWAAFL